VEWAPNLAIGLGLLINGAVLSALAIGVSAFRSMLSRIALLLAGVLITVLCVSLPFGFTAGMIDQAGAGWFLMLMVAGNGLAASALLCILGLQMARVRLRLYEDPLDPAPGSQVVVLYLFTPVLVGLPASMCGLPGIVSGLLFCWIGLLIDRAPKPNERAHYAQS
jgi:hypothetical protein